VWGTNRTTLLNLVVSLAGAREDALTGDEWALVDQIIQGSDVNLGNHRGWTPLHQASTPSMIERLLRGGADVRAEAHGSGGTPLAGKLFWGDRAGADALAASGIVPGNLRIASGLGRTDLVEASFAPNGELTAQAKAGRGFYRPHVGFPIWEPADSRQEILDEALTYAARNGRVNVLDALVARGANVNGDPYRGTPLAWAAWANQVDTARWLLAHGANVNQQATFGGPGHGNGITALHLAAQHNHVEAARVLLDAGADPGIEDRNYHSSPAGWAAHFQNQQVADLIASRASRR
jgi:ankyrin repeat protein